VVYGLYVLSSVNHPVCHRRQRDAQGIIADLSARPRGARTTRLRRPRKSPLVKYSAFASTAFRTTFVTIAIRPFVGSGTEKVRPQILKNGKKDIFRAGAGQADRLVKEARS
jgi:hypothetical protein